MPKRKKRSATENKRDNVRNSAQKRGIEFDLSLKEVERLLKARTCAICLVSFGKELKSFDRIDPAYGYIYTNLQVVCCTCNHTKSKNEWCNQRIERIWIEER